ncbi:MAG: DUF5696 domain-containing protein [Oscillospiraceae bacterium]|jgi:hypothetical protein|nr:DUF5696 domain-containing protein [Oscillospiraceae bacterium]
MKTKRIPWKAISISLAAAIVLAVGAWQLYLHIHYTRYDGYKALLSHPAEGAQAYPFAPIQSDITLDGFTPALASGTLALFVNSTSGDIAVYDTRTGEFTYSNPPQADADTLANSTNKDALKSQLVITFYDSNGKVAEYSSYKMAAQANQIEFFTIDGGIRAVYTLGDTKPAAGILPVYLKEERLAEILSQFDERTASLLSRRWEKADGYPGVVKLVDAIKNNPTQVKSTAAQFEKIGYTDEDRIRDELESGAELEQKLGFVIPIEYRLTDGDLLVTVPTASIKELGGASIETIRVLPFFGAAGVTDTGYIVVPNGSGATINFNNGKTGADDYRAYVYGIDPLLVESAQIDISVPTRLPLFGLQKPKQGILARVENGAPLAQITACVSGKLNSYNYVYPTFRLRAASAITLSGSGTAQTRIPVVEKPKAELDIQVRYTFLDDEHEGYSGMARYERRRLIDEGKLAPMKPETADIPLFADVIGSVASRQFFLDIAYQGILPMTTFKQAQDIAAELKALGVAKQYMNYQGWFNGGFYHDAVNFIKPVKQLGDTGGLAALEKTLEEDGGRLFTDVAIQNVPYYSEGFRYTYEDSRYYGASYTAVFGSVDPLSYNLGGELDIYADTWYHSLSPKFLPRYTDSFVNAFDRYSLNGVSLRDLGNTLQSDRKRTDVVDRAQAEELAADSLCKLDGEYNLMVNGANYYALPYADAVSGAPLTVNTYAIIDSAIPFYEMIVSGCLPYAGEPLNIGADTDITQTALHLIEYGASPRYAFTYEPASKMKYTALNYMYSATFDNLKQNAAEMYAKVNGVLSQVYGQAMTMHERSGDIARVTYDSGTIIEIDYHNGDVRVFNDKP